MHVDQRVHERMNKEQVSKIVLTCKDKGQLYKMDQMEVKSMKAVRCE